jgi:serine/threonine protein phosphatase PrpC
VTANISKRPKWSAISPLLRPGDSPPPSTKVEVNVYAQSRRGPTRATNTDHYVAVRLGRDHNVLLTSVPADEIPERFEESSYGMVVADGMGHDGEAASRLAVTTLVELSVCFGRWNLRVNEPLADDVKDRAERFFRSIDSILLRASQNRPGGSLQTTMTACYSAGNELFFAHVGDSRAYIFRDDELMQLTRDHTVEGDSSRAVVVDLTSREPSPGRSRAESLGRRGTGAASIDVERLSLLDGDLVLLCTNGLTDVLDDGQIADVLQGLSVLSDVCEALVDAATRAGATDDVTVLVAHYQISDHPLIAPDDAAEH